MQRWRFSTLLLGTFLLTLSSVLAQMPLEEDMGDCGGELNNPQRGNTTPINQDYFSMDRYPGTKCLVRLVEQGHVNERVMKEFRAGAYDSVIADLKYALERVTNHPRALMLLCSVARMTHAPALPIPYFERALKLYPNYAFTHAQFGLYLTTIEDHDAGIVELKRATELDPTMAQAWAWLAGAYQHKRQPEPAREAAKRARELGYDGPIEGLDGWEAGK